MTLDPPQVGETWEEKNERGGKEGKKAKKVIGQGKKMRENSRERVQDWWKIVWEGVGKKIKEE